jgi:hypothetical protein
VTTAQGSCLQGRLLQNILGGAESGDHMAFQIGLLNMSE